MTIYIVVPRLNRYTCFSSIQSRLNRTPDIVTSRSWKFVRLETPGGFVPMRQEPPVDGLEHTHRERQHIWMYVVRMRQWGTFSQYQEVVIFIHQSPSFSLEFLGDFHRNLSQPTQELFEQWAEHVCLLETGPSGKWSHSKSKPLPYLALYPGRINSLLPRNYHRDLSAIISFVPPRRYRVPDVALADPWVTIAE